MNVDIYRAQVNRLYDQEREERNERRGLEQRAATVLGAVLVVLGLVVNAGASERYDGNLATTIFIVLGAFVALAGALFVVAGLVGAHTNEELSFKQALLGHLQRPSPDTPDHTTPNLVELEPAPLTDEYLHNLQARVSRLANANARLVVLIRFSSAALGIGALSTMYGFAAGAIF